MIRRSALLSLLLVLGGCHGVSPDFGEEAVLIRQPWFFGAGGVVAEPVAPGLRWVAWTTDHVMVNMQPQQFGVHFEDLMSSDGVPLDFDAVLRLQVTNSVRLISEFGTDWFNRNVAAEFQNRVRQSVRKHGMNETAISTVAIEEIDDEVTVAMEEYLIDADLPLNLIQVTVGRANPPDAVKDQRVATATEQQRQLTEQQRKIAEDARLEAERSRAAADNAYRNSLGLSPAQFISLEAINMQRAACTGGTTCTFVLNGSALPTISVP
jgi:regulator of protease activity HflC (stomatin/prohibitin superfamily)